MTSTAWRLKERGSEEGKPQERRKNKGQKKKRIGYTETEFEKSYVKCHLRSTSTTRSYLHTYVRVYSIGTYAYRMHVYAFHSFLIQFFPLLILFHLFLSSFSSSFFFLPRWARRSLFFLYMCQIYANNLANEGTYQATAILARLISKWKVG